MVQTCMNIAYTYTHINMAVWIYLGPVPGPVPGRRLRDLEICQLFWPVPRFTSGPASALGGALEQRHTGLGTNYLHHVCLDVPCLDLVFADPRSHQARRRTGQRTGVMQGGRTGTRKLGWQGEEGDCGQPIKRLA